MFKRTSFVKKLAATALMFLSAASYSATHEKHTLDWTAFKTNEAGFLRAPVLITGKSEAVLIDSNFNYSDGKAVADAIKASGKKLTTVYITTNDPDYYFGLEPVRQAFPGARILAAPDTVALMKKKSEGKIKAWAGQLGKNGPASVSELIFPEASNISTLTVDGETLEIVNEPGLKDRGRYIWVPSLRAVFGGVAVFGGMYPWVADAPTVEDRNAWRAALDNILARKPKIVVPGHVTAASPLDASNVTYTRDYLNAFEDEVAKAADSAALIAAMKKRYPNEAMPVSLELGAKVAKGEMTWGK
ncbi:MBL fold metallo-hydrolase [Pectobacterium brasiliense]|uniref:MBL fold metallo-hydrolase n=1 Tax=Pectobacterium brasiliense TaxID=180957 RepID=UPI001CE181C2|nr:MBL fold metallo-hydrolase [Pectobacterium brasiliense]MCA5918495.1 MBL fold metallo-hydrolase [Pectobacterium brasiliense]MCA5925966.1 MBL fold metallo-hydrolase [Pectobacterium brasiliense]MCA5934359.1 MBL fold metallo-hydrolase [Pectobacterium brasiliense]MCA5938541.1 MBL fold metallo-hydrolase [Pectobacterium brasiliense]MCA5943871.1 MBL fold metallo-hydrolase [Pectobacterium brasiliense]